jgi:hypothetical protein
MYNIVYKRSGVTVPREQIETINGLNIAGGGPADTLSIKRARGYSSFPALPEVVTDGGLKKLYTEADIASLEVDGALKNLTAKRSYVEYVQAGSVGTVNMTATPNSTQDGDYLFSSITSAGTAGALKANARLSGVSLDRLEAPTQTGSVRVASKKYRVRGAIPFASYGGLMPRSGYSDAGLGDRIVGGPYRSDLVSDDVRRSAASVMVRDPREVLSASPEALVGSEPKADVAQVYLASAQTISVSGGGIFSERILTGTCPKISARSMKYTYTSGGYNWVVWMYGHIDCHSIVTGGPKLQVSAAGGNLTPSGIATAGAITKIEAKQATHRFPSGTLVLWGGTFVCPTIQAGASLSDGAALPEADGLAPGIGLIRGDNGVNIWYDSGDQSVYYYLGDMLAGSNCAGSIKTILTKSPSAKDLQSWVQSVGGPFVCGTAYSATEPKVKNGLTNYYTWEDCQ